MHESGRIINPTARDQIRGATIQGIGQAIHEDLLYDPRSGQPLTPDYYRARHLTHGPSDADSLSRSMMVMVPLELRRRESQELFGSDHG